MQWFKHNTNATQEAKLKKVILRYGAEGYAVYFHCLELIAGAVSDSNITFELEHDSEIIADNLKIKGTADKSPIQVVEEIVRYIVELGLFEESGNRIFCYSLLRALDASMTSNKRFRAFIAKAKESHDDAMMSHDDVMTNHNNVMLEKNRIEENRKENKIIEEKRIEKFKKPSLEEISEYCKIRNNGIDPQSFFNFYEAKGWKIGKEPMRDWQAAVRTWERRQMSEGKPLRIFTQTASFDIPEA